MAMMKEGDGRTKRTSITYHRWKSMRRRVKDKPSGYEHVTMCTRWEVYENFLEDMGKCPEGYSLDRKENSRGYNQFNCRWIPLLQQSWNKTTNIEFEGVNLKRLCRLVGVNDQYSTILKRITVNKTRMGIIEAILHMQPIHRAKEIKFILNDNFNLSL